jgi:hypothetical protein
METEIMVYNNIKQQCVNTILESCNMLAYIGIDDLAIAELTIFTRILHLFNAMLYDEKLNINHILFIQRLMKSHKFKSVWNKDGLTRQTLQSLINYLQENMSNNISIYKACNDILNPDNLLIEVKHIFALKTPAQEQPVQEQPVQEQPVQEQPVQEQPVQEQPVTLFTEMI